MKKRLRLALLLSLILITSFASSAQTIPIDSLYLSQVPPGDVPKVFIPSASARIAISHDGKELYYRSIVSGLNCFRYFNNKWNGPAAVFTNSYYAPTFSVDGNTLYFHLLGDNNYDIWSSSRNDTGWNSPSLFANGLYYFQTTTSGHSYAGSTSGLGGIGGWDICRVITNGSSITLQSMGVPLNTTNNDAEFFIAKDESFIVLGANEVPNGGGRDLYVSYRKSDSTWTSPKSLGPLINDGPVNKWGPYVTAENKYLFYAKATSPYNIYWVRFDRLLDSLRHTNFPPYIKNQIPNQIAAQDSLYHYQVPDSTFYDEDHDPLTYSAILSNGSALPSWLTFDPMTRTFSGTPLTAERPPLYIKVVATDTAHASCSCDFKLGITTATGIEKGSNQLPQNMRLFQNYPNPFNPTTTIRYSLTKFSWIKLDIYNIMGQKIQALQNGFQNAGEHSVVWNSVDEQNRPVSSGVYFYRLEADNAVMQKQMVLIK